MTFLELQDAVLDRLNLSSDDARTRLKVMINERIRRIQTSCNLGRVRRGTQVYTLASGDNTITTAAVAAVVADPMADPPVLAADAIIAVIKPHVVSIPAQRRILGEVTLDSIRQFDPGDVHTSIPSRFSILSYNPGDVTLLFDRHADADYVIKVDGIVAGTALVDDGDVPAFPEDFHDAVTYGVMADESFHFDKPDRAAMFEKMFDTRVRECRYFITKSRYLHRVQNQDGVGMDAWWWAFQAPWFIGA